MKNTDRQNAKYISPDNQTMVRGWWVYRGGCLWLGEITVATAASIRHFSSTTPMSAASLAMYAGGNS